MNEVKVGWIEVICGPMFSGKTEELIRRINRAILANQSTIIFKPVVDTRYSTAEIVSHDARNLSAQVVSSSGEILKRYDGSAVVGIDEAQFFDNGIVDVCNYLANKGARVIVSGLDMDWQGKPFGAMPILMAIAEKVTKLTAICLNCGAQASYSYRIFQDDALIVVGGKEKYIPLCRKCFNEYTASSHHKGHY